MISKSLLNVPSAYIGTKKNRLKIYDEKIVFLENGQEFQFEILNPTKDVIGVNIWINGKLSSDSKLVLKPGESTWLDRHIDKPKKYVFETYDVDNNESNKKAIEDNGKIKFEFYRQKEKRNLLFGNNQDITYTYYNTNPSWRDTWTTNDITYIQDNTFYGCDIRSQTYSSNIETGRIEEGSNSKQTFNNVYYEFEYSSFHTVEYQILPKSQKNIVTTDEIRKYCVNCGTRIKKTNWKFCPNCGEEI